MAASDARGGGNDAPHSGSARGAAAVSIAAMISIFAALNGSILSGSRVPYAAAREGYFFRGYRRAFIRNIARPGSRFWR